MKQALLGASAFVLVGALSISAVGVGVARVSAQVVPPRPGVTSQMSLVWDQPAATLAEAQGFVYNLIVDSVPATVPLLPVLCVGSTPPYTCTSAFPALTPGDHGIQLMATVMVDGKPVKSELSTPPLLVRMILAPRAPMALRIAAGS